MKKIYGKFISLFMIVSILFSLFYVDVFAARTVGWDGSSVGDDSSGKFLLFDFNNLGDILSIQANTQPTGKYSEPGRLYSIHWNNHPANQQLRFYTSNKVPTDWSDINYLQIKIYSEKITKEQMQLNIYSPTGPTGLNYWFKHINVDWTGWKTIKVVPAELDAVRNPDITNISHVELTCSTSWKLTPKADTDLYISDISISLGGVNNFVYSFYDEGLIRESIKNLKDSAAVYGGGNNVVTSQGVLSLGYETIWQNEKVYLPVSFFKKYFMADISDNENGFQIKKGDNVISESDFEADEVLNFDGGKYVYAQKCAMALGLNAYADSKLLVMGTTEAVNAVKRAGHLGVNEKNEIISYLAYHNDNYFEALTHDEVVKMRKHWLKLLVGDQTTNDMSIDSVKAKIDDITNEAKDSFELMKTNTDPRILFKGLDAKFSEDMGFEYGKIRRMAYAYACYGSELYKNPEIFDAVISGLDWLKEHRLSDKSWLTGFDNWYQWDISVPNAIAEILLCVEDEISEDKYNEYVKTIDSLCPVATSTGHNYAAMATIVLCSGLLQHDMAKVNSALVGLEKMYMFVDDNKRFVESFLSIDKYDKSKGSGFFTDGSYVYHTLHAFNGGYGKTHFETLALIESILGGSALDNRTPNRENIKLFWERSMLPFIYGPIMPKSVRGRSTGATYGGALEPLVAAFEMAEYVDDEFKNGIYSVVKSISQNYPEWNFKDSISLHALKRYEEVMTNDDIKPSDNVEFNKMFYNMDKAIHNSGDWYMSVSMSSSRIFNYDSLSSANVNGWYQGDGRTEYYINGTDINSTADYWYSIDPYRLPGTTVDTQERQQVSINQGQEYLSSKDFVGGVSLGGKYGVAAMELESFHNDIEPTTAPSPYGGSQPVHKNDLTAQKGYFMFDEEMVCLGSAVNASDNNNAEVLTIIDSLLAEKTNNLDGVEVVEPYVIQSAIASATPEAENVAENTIDDSLATKWAGKMGMYITWDLGESKPLGFAHLSFMNGSVRKQYFSIEVSENGTDWTDIFDGESSGKKETNDLVGLENATGRYVRFTNKGNSLGSEWVSLAECVIYPPNPDGSIGVADPEIYGADPVSVDGNIVNLTGEDMILGNAGWINANDICGYVFPEDSALNRGTLKARWTKGKNSHFQLWFSHGINPSNGSYSYVLLPNTSAEQTKQYASDMPVEILANTPGIQAVRNKKLGVTGIIFWKAGSFDGIYVSQPCIVMYSKTEYGMDISVSDPTQKLTSLTIRMDENLKPVSVDDCASVSNANNHTIIRYNMENSVGRSMECRFETND